MKLRPRIDALEKSGSSPADLVICSTAEEATRRKIPLEALVIVTGVPRNKENGL